MYIIVKINNEYRVEQRPTVKSYSTREAAQEAVDFLNKYEFRDLNKESAIGVAPKSTKTKETIKKENDKILRGLKR